MNIQHVILDRDGVLNREAPNHGYILSVEDFQWLPGALDALALLRAAGLRLSIATNQSAVGRGLMGLGDLNQVIDHMRAQAQAAGGAIDAVFCCPHGPDEGCACRKPKPGLLLAAIAASGISPGHTVFVGDDLRDVEAAVAAGVAPVLVRTGKGTGVESKVRALGVGFEVPTYDNLFEYARILTLRDAMPSS